MTKLRAKCESGCFDVEISEAVEKLITENEKYHVCTTCFSNVIIYDHDGKTVSKYIEDLAKDLEPKTHCCECTPGENFERHMVHIQYPNCTCDKAKYVLKGNYE